MDEVIAALAERQSELGMWEKSDPEYRKAGLPVVSSYVEWAVKQFNYRVKGSEKFWTEDGAEEMLQLRGVTTS